MTNLLIPKQMYCLPDFKMSLFSEPIEVTLKFHQNQFLKDFIVIYTNFNFTRSSIREKENLNITKNVL